ncbi:necrosis inducing protein [Truncatella angustata]|uniref:Necrosis inducing protein n=1 Tax=Truncatella angustata TaxID=152316 RepID=A0A9P8ZW75_9PEZI|nr:necrosis inducing protein [Truncatella angustata]KAH6652756.1 necrosis inducing protein [Truncatella angustata]
MQLIKSLSLAALGASAPAVLAGPLLRRGTVGNDDIVGLPQTVPSTTAGTLYLKYKPFLYRLNGCVPYPAVDASGNTNEGLSPTGDPAGDCTSSTGQIYTRSESANGAFAIMYAWYWPKDEPSALEGSLGIGHRHDWESAVVWLSSESTTATVLGVAASAHGGFAAKAASAVTFSGTGPLIEYESNGILDHSLTFTTTKGDQQPLVAWESLDSTIQSALANTDWGDANVPFIDANFANNLVEAQL